MLGLSILAAAASLAGGEPPVVEAGSADASAGAPQWAWADCKAKFKKGYVTGKKKGYKYTKELRAIAAYGIASEARPQTIYTCIAAPLKQRYKVHANQVLFNDTGEPIFRGDAGESCRTKQDWPICRNRLFMTANRNVKVCSEEGKPNEIRYACPVKLSPVDRITVGTISQWQQEGPSVRKLWFVEFKRN